MKELKALVVDDSKVMRLMVMKSLRQSKIAEFEFDEAENGAVALEKFKTTENDFDILFVDINMPEMNGIEFVEGVRSCGKNATVPAVMITSEKTMGKVEQAMDEAGANAYICKPFTVEELQKKLGIIIDGIGTKKKKSGGFFSKLAKG